MSTEIRTSPEIGEIAKALAAAQGAIENVGTDGKNPAFKRNGKESGYATLANVLTEVRPKLAKEGIAVIQMPVNGEGSNVGIVTRLTHSSGQWIESALYVAPAQFTAQAVGSVLTYLRRYSLMAVAGVGPEDDDGNAAVARPEPRPAPQPRTADHVPPNANGANGVNGSALPPNPKEPQAVANERARIRRLIDTVKNGIDTAPNIDVLDERMDGYREYLTQIEGAGEAGAEAANTLRARYNSRVPQLRGGK